MSIITELPETFTDTTIPVLYRDPIINAGTLFCHDFGTAFCWDPTAIVANLAPIKNLVDTRPDARIDLSSAGSLTYDPAGGGGFVMATVDGRIKLDDGTQYFRSGFADNYLLVLWLKLVTPPPSSVGVLHLTKSSSAFDAIALGVGRSGDSPSGSSAAFMGSTSTVKNGGVYTPGATPVQIAFASEGGQLKYYENGTIQAAVTGSTTIVDSTAPLCLGKTQVSGGYTGVLGTKYYRTWAENLTTSGKTAQERLTQDYLANAGRFS